MGRVFKRHKDIKVRYPEDIKMIRDYLTALGELNCTDYELEGYWKDFSEEVYCAGYLDVCDGALSEFAMWLEQID